jgi:hypothetical protein
VAYADLLKLLAESPAGVYIGGPDEAAVREAVEAGLVEVRSNWGADHVELTAAGRRMLGLPESPSPWRALQQWIAGLLA